jgi:GNAT superfamily N-acetyltransferase
MPTTGALSTAPLRLVPASGRRRLNEFIRLPARLYAGAAGYAAPLELERREALTRGKNPYFEHAEAQLWLAYRGDRAVGRISAQIDRRYLERYGDDTGHFGFLDAVDDPAVFALLTRTAEDWLRARGMRRALGPLSFSTNEESGLMVEGFAARPMLLMGYHPPFAGTRLAEQGYLKVKDLIAYDYDIVNAPPFRARKVIERAIAGGGFTIRRLDMRRYAEDINAALDIYIDAWSGNWGFVPPTKAETEHTVRALKPLVRPEMVHIAEIDGVPVGMIVCLPNLAEAVAGLKGRLLPLGWARLLWRLKVSGLTTCRVLLYGVLKRYQGSGLGSAIALTLLQELRSNALKIGFLKAELSWILEDNLPMRRINEGIGGKGYKLYRVYDKALA